MTDDMLSSKIAVVTGGGSGLGQQIAIQLAEKNIRVYIIGRRDYKLAETQAYSKNNIIPICADVSTSAGREFISDNLKNIKINYLIHNAAIVIPITPLEKLSLEDFRAIQAINVEGPLFLTKLLLPKLNNHGRILHISSDCAQNGLAYWTPYCSSKSALSMIYQCLKKELLKKNIYVGSIDPGMMDTPMQQYICSDEVKFPEKFTRKELQENNLLLNPKFSASLCVKLLLEFSAEKFSEREWCAYNF